MPRGADYYNRVGRAESGYDSNPVKVKYTADFLSKVAYNEAVFGSPKNYWIWIQQQVKEAIATLGKDLLAIIEQANLPMNTQTTDIINTVAGLATVTGVGAPVGIFLGVIGIFSSLVERSGKKSDIEIATEKANKIQAELLKQQALFEKATAELKKLETAPEPAPAPPPREAPQTGLFLGLAYKIWALIVVLLFFVWQLKTKNK